MELDSGMWALIGALAAIVISVVGAVLGAKARGEALTLGELGAETFSPLRQVIDEAEGWVAVAQHLWETGQIDEVNGVKDPRFVWVYDRVSEVLPDIDAQTLEYGIEAAVKFAKAAMALGEKAPEGSLQVGGSDNLIFTVGADA